MLMTQISVHGDKKGLFKAAIHSGCAKIQFRIWSNSGLFSNTGLSHILPHHY
jgi:hypothetical protein